MLLVAATRCPYAHLHTPETKLPLWPARPHLDEQDPASGTRVGLRLRTLRTRLPSEAEAAPSFLLSEDAGVLAHASAAARGSIQKGLAVEGLALYWEPGTGGPGGTAHAPASAGPVAGAAQPTEPTQPEAAGQARRRRRPKAAAAPPPSAYLLHPTDVDIHTTLQLSAPSSAADGGDGGGGMRVHMAAVVHHLQLSLSGVQAADILELSDRLEWVAARNRVAAYCPAGWRARGPRAVPWRCVAWRVGGGAGLAWVGWLRGVGQPCVLPGSLTWLSARPSTLPPAGAPGSTLSTRCCSACGASARARCSGPTQRPAWRCASDTWPSTAFSSSASSWSGRRLPHVPPRCAPTRPGLGLPASRGAVAGPASPAVLLCGPATVSTPGAAPRLTPARRNLRAGRRGRRAAAATGAAPVGG